MVWCRRKLPKVGSIIRCPEEELEEHKVVEVAERGVRAAEGEGNDNQMCVRLDDGNVWWVFKCCEVRREVAE